MLANFETLLDRTPPVWVRRLEAAALMRVFARSFDVEPPSPSTLAAFREFTAACMQAALADSAVSTRYRIRLGEGARELGTLVRKALAVRPHQAFRVTRFFYRGIGIELSGELPGTLRFGPCYFAQRYSSQCCAFMAAFDEGFMRGITGFDGAELAFSCRLTEGASCCLAVFARVDGLSSTPSVSQRFDGR